MASANPDLEKQLLHSEKYRLSIQESSNMLENKKTTYRFHSKYRRIRLGFKIFLIPVLITILAYLIYQVDWYSGLLSDLSTPLFEIKYFEFIEELEKEDDFSSVKPNPHLYIALSVLNRSSVHFYLLPESIELVYNSHEDMHKRNTKMDESLMKITKFSKVMYPSTDFKINNKIGGPLEPINSDKFEKIMKEDRLILKVNLETAFVGIFSRKVKKVALEVRFRLSENITEKPAFLDKPTIPEPTMYEAKGDDTKIEIVNKRIEFYTKLDWSTIDVILFPYTNGTLKCLLKNKDSSETENKYEDWKVRVLKVFIYKKDFGIIFEDIGKQSIENKLKEGVCAEIDFEVEECDQGKNVYCGLLKKLGKIKLWKSDYKI